MLVHVAGGGEQSATDVTGWDILQGNVPREMETMVATVEGEEIEIMEAVDIIITQKRFSLKAYRKRHIGR